ncbi:hypothetical protein AQUCO_02200215v1 [Aquilegia coerulea]|uniref:F-box domain-containing protein n=3 Tax=Aquilegia coerulea TaxID=218851 RepID=A0A2G5DDM7_AQUCA|nr:hypothetical protein AQUCO_02200215v1 [Aquilegia coerulea]PIA41628.1 hypothetical protein AQUCO_02200215v1 [Aquilegia coerulea]PIA41629.1 hypothetical protein AQUCO_02200215v1 [Aquilegia coerulea]
MQHVRVLSHQGPVHKLGDSQMTLSPKFRLAPIEPASLLQLNMESELLACGEPLIPGLPDDIALDCLLRLPVQSHPSCRVVCKRWHLLLGTKERFFSKRKELGYQNPWLFIFTYQKGTGKMQWQVLDLTNMSWHTIPPMPCKERICPNGLSCVSIPHKGTLFVCGGTVSDMDCPLNLVLKYEIHKNRWSVMNKMSTARSFFASGIIDGMVYVAGGNSSELYELESAEVLDPIKGNWKSIANMGANMASYDAAVLNGKLFVTEGWLWPFLFSPRGQVYDPRSNSWETMSASLREGWTGLSVAIDGHLFVVSEHERMKLKVYDMKTDSWDIVAGSPLPEEICKPFSINSFECRIYVIGYSLHVAIGHLRKMNLKCTSRKKWCYLVEWEIINAPQAFCGWSPSSSQVVLG